ncbi:MAG: hypothetical protein JXR95_08345 [Deltaproteobacteria bacterium]|nr:hypothetical protein [Deltaproteobacteria bacterium]
MNPRHYRIVINFDNEEQLFIGSVPEFQDCTVKGENWEEVTSLLEEEVNKRLENLEYPPTPIDAGDLDGKLSLEMSKSLYRELLFLAKHDEIEPEALAMELISEGMGRRYGGNRYYRAGSNYRKQGRSKGDRNNNYSREQYHNIMEDKAHFLEYVRNLEQSGGSNKGRR